MYMPCDHNLNQFFTANRILSGFQSLCGHALYHIYWNPRWGFYPHSTLGKRNIILDLSTDMGQVVAVASAPALKHRRLYSGGKGGGVGRANSGETTWCLALGGVQGSCCSSGSSSSSNLGLGLELVLLPGQGQSHQCAPFPWPSWNQSCQAAWSCREKQMSEGEGTKGGREQEVRGQVPGVQALEEGQVAWYKWGGQGASRLPSCTPVPYQCFLLCSKSRKFKKTLCWFQIIVI